MQLTFENFGLIEDIIDKTPTAVVANIGKLEWTQGTFKIQSWGNTIHRIAPYVGRIKPSFAHFLIRYTAKKGDIILDPFCGIGTIVTEAAIMGYKSIGVDLNPYAICISRAKRDNKRHIHELIDYIEKLEIDTSSIDTGRIPEWVRNYYNQETLKEILYTIEVLQKDKQDFLLGCLVGISQGHRPGHLSKPCAWTLPYKPRPDDKGEYRALKPRLIEKVKRTFSKDFSNMEDIEIILADSRKLPLPSESINHIISSPPYYDTLDYVNSHRLRLAILGIYNEDDKKELSKSLIQDYKSYIANMKIVIEEFSRVIKKGGYCILVLGDHFKNKKVINTAEELKPILIENNFTCHAIIEDRIPINKSVQKSTSTVKSERIMVLTKN